MDCLNFCIGHDEVTCPRPAPEPCQCLQVNISCQHPPHPFLQRLVNCPAASNPCLKVCHLQKQEVTKSILRTYCSGDFSSTVVKHQLGIPTWKLFKGRMPLIQHIFLQSYLVYCTASLENKDCAAACANVAACDVVRCAVQGFIGREPTTRYLVPMTIFVASMRCLYKVYQESSILSFLLGNTFCGLPGNENLL